MAMGNYEFFWRTTLASRGFAVWYHPSGSKAALLAIFTLQSEAEDYMRERWEIDKNFELVLSGPDGKIIVDYE